MVSAKPLIEENGFTNEIPSIFKVSYFCYLMKIFSNKKSHHERSTIRNIIFDCLRCLLADIFFVVIDKGSEIFFVNDFAFSKKLI